MKYILYITAFLIFGPCVTSCKHSLSQKEDNYPEDTLVSNFQGQPKNSSTLYFPYQIKNKDTILSTGLDTMTNEWFSYSLCKFKEPVLSNFYLGNDMYRFLWLRSFHRPVVLTLSKNENRVTLTTKEFDGRAHYFELKRCMNCDTTNFKEPRLVLNETKELTSTEWENFEVTLKQCDFWNTIPCKREIGCDGAEWTIEAHLKEKYWFVNRWTPKGKFADCGKYLITLSGLKEAIY